MINPYLSLVLQQTPRILTQIDRDPDSPTYGCCDRNFWHYKIRDFSSAILQQAGLGLAYLYCYNRPENPYYQKQEIKDIAIATVSYWQKIQHTDGSFDEYWPSERSIPATVFSLYAVCEIAKLFHLSHPSLLRSIRKSAQFLTKNSENNALNQEISSMCALYNASIVLNSPTLRKEAEKKRSKLMTLQNSEGWFAEYGGADIGYLTVSLNFMAEYYLLSNNQQAKESCIKMINFLQYFVHPDGSLGGDYGSRNTEYFLPAGWEISSSFHLLSKSIIKKILPYLEQDFSVDDRYLTHYIFSSFAKAMILFQPQKQPSSQLPHERSSTQYFPHAGLYIHSNTKYYAITALSKGGVTVIFDKKNKRRLLNDCGYRAINTKNIAVTNWTNKEYYCHFNNTASHAPQITLQTSFYQAKFHIPTSLQHLALRIASRLLRKKIIDIMKKKLILPSKREPITLQRTITFYPEKITINDIINAQKVIATIKNSEGLSLRYCPSSRFYQTSMLQRARYFFEQHNVRKTSNKKTVFIQ